MSKIQKTITIIGGYGALGKWFAKFFQDLGMKVIIYGRNKEKLLNTAQELDIIAHNDLISAVSKADIIWLSVPIPNTSQIIYEISSYLQPNAYVVEIASIKTDAVNAFEQIIKNTNKIIHCISIHPMFGPGATDLQNKKVLFIPINNDYEIFNYFWSIFEEKGAICQKTDVQEHDIMMNRVLSLPHFMNMAFMWLISDSKQSPNHTNSLIPEIMPFAGTTFQMQKTISEAVLNENPVIYSPIQLENAYFKKSLLNFRKFLDDYIEMIETKDNQQFYKIFHTLQAYCESDPAYHNSYDTFYKLLETLKKNEQS